MAHAAAKTRAGPGRDPDFDENLARPRPIVTVSLIVLCVLASTWELPLGDTMDPALAVLGFTPDAFSQSNTAQSPSYIVPVWATLPTSMFLQAGTLHIAGNMPLLVVLYPFRVRAVWVVGVWFALLLVSAVLTPASEPGTA